MSAPLLQHGPSAKRRRACAARYFAGLGLVLLSAAIEQLGHVWNRLDQMDTATFKALPVAALLVPFGLGALLTISATHRFQAWGYPVAGRGDLGGLDERQQLRFLEAQAGAQRIYVGLAVLAGALAVFAAPYWSRGGYSWFLGLQVSGFVIALVSGLPTALLAWSEP